MVAVISEVMKGVVRWPPSTGTPNIMLQCPLTKRSCCLCAPLKRPLANGCFAMELAVIGHCFKSDLHPVRQLKVFQAFLLEWVKSIPYFFPFLITVLIELVYQVCSFDIS